MKKLLCTIAVASVTFVAALTNVSAWDYDGSDNIYFDYTPTYNESYYSSLNGLSQDDFREELNDIISASYNKYSYSNRYTVLQKADATHDNSSKVWCLYTGKLFDLSDNGSSGTSTYNTEHTWAKSYGFPNSSDTPYTDMHHLRITECQINSTRGNKWFGEVNGTPDQYGNVSSGSVFEPRDSVKGDVARMLLYMDVRYDGKNGEPDLVLIDGYSATSGSALHGDLETLLKWHELDPVDDRERLRNDVVFQYQKNRNPFIDHPEYVNVIWGDGSLDKPDQEYADIFDLMVADIKTPISVSSLNEIEEALNYYYSLTEAQKALTSNSDVLFGYYEEYNNLFPDNQKNQVLDEAEDDLDILDLILKGDYEGLFDRLNQ